jgi:hypothetical protein
MHRGHRVEVEASHPPTGQAIAGVGYRIPRVGNANKTNPREAQVLEIERIPSSSARIGGVDAVLRIAQDRAFAR